MQGSLPPLSLKNNKKKVYNKNEDNRILLLSRD